MTTGQTMTHDQIDQLGIDRSDSAIQPAGMTYERALAIAVRSSRPVPEPTAAPAYDLVVKYASEGLSDLQIARETGLKRSTVTRYRNRAGIRSNTTNRVELDWTQPEMIALKERIVEFYTNQWPAKAIAQKLELEERVVNNALKRYRHDRKALDKRKAQRLARIARGGKA